MADKKQGSDILTPTIREVKKNKQGQFVPNNEQLRILVRDENIKLNQIDTSEVTDMSYLFAYIADDDDYINGHIKTNVILNFEREDFNGIKSWDTSRVINFEGMFYCVLNFNEPIGNWDTSNVTNMSIMFYGATKFNQSLNEWNTSSVTNMSRMFLGAFEFNQPLNNWDTSMVADMSGMFVGAGKFNQPLSKWNTSNVVNMISIFYGATSFNQDLSAWGDKLGKVQSMKQMFSHTKSLTIDFISLWKIPEDCDISDITKGSGLEYKENSKSRDKSVEGENKIQSIPKAKLSNFEIYKIEFDESVLSGLKEDESFVEEWLPESIQENYQVFLTRYDKENERLIQGDKKEWYFVFCKVFDSWFVIKKDDNEIPPKIGKITLPFRIYQGRSVEELKRAGDFDESKMYDTRQGLAFYFEQTKMRILNTARFDMGDIVRDIVAAVVLAKAYNVKMEKLSERAKNGDIKKLQECHTEVCEFDLRQYRSIPIMQSGESSNGILTEVWLQIFNVCFVAQKHDELKEAIAQMARLFTDNKRDKQSLWFSVAAVAIAFVSFVVATISAIPIIEKWFH